MVYCVQNCRVMSKQKYEFSAAYLNHILKSQELGSYDVSVLIYVF